MMIGIARRRPWCESMTSISNNRLLESIMSTWTVHMLTVECNRCRFAVHYTWRYQWCLPLFSYPFICCLLAHACTWTFSAHMWLHYCKCRQLTIVRSSQTCPPHQLSISTVMSGSYVVKRSSERCDAVLWRKQTYQLRKVQCIHTCSYSFFFCSYDRRMCPYPRWPSILLSSHAYITAIITITMASGRGPTTSFLAIFLHHILVCDICAPAGLRYHPPPTSAASGARRCRCWPHDTFWG